MVWYCRKAVRISSRSLTKSTTKVVSLPGWARFSRDRVCTAWMLPSLRSTYMAHNSGWSKPVWNLLATSRMLNCGVVKASRRSRP